MKKFILLCCLFSAARLMATTAPNFTVTSSDNQTLQLYQNYINQGKVVVIEAFFTTCPPCNAHAPLLQNLYTQMLAAYPGKVEFILLSTLSSDSNVKVAQYKTSKGLTMPAVGANGGSQTALQPYLSGQFGPFEGTPTFIVIAPNTGQVHFDIKGNSASQTMTLLSEKIAELLPSPPPPPPTPVYCNMSNYFGGNLTGVALEVSTGTFDTTLNVYSSYSLTNIASLQNKTYSLKPTKNDDPLDGLTTYDLVLISKHILGIEALDCEWQRLAADVNCSGTITTLDIVTARKVLLGITQNLPCGSWKFVPDSATAMNGNCVEFYGIKTGDITAGICIPFSGPPQDRSNIIVDVEDQLLKAGETVFLTLSISEYRHLQGMQGRFSFDPAKVRIGQLSSPTLKYFDADAYSLSHVQQGAVPFSWINPQGQAMDAGDVLINIQITALQAGNLSDLLSLDETSGIRPEAYDVEGQVHPLEIRWHKNDVAASAFLISPNPAKGDFTVSAMLDVEQDCRLQMLDIQGKIIREETFLGTKGLNNFTINRLQFLPGLYAVRMNGRIVGKVMVQ